MIDLRNFEELNTARQYMYMGICFGYNPDTGYYEIWLDDGAHRARTMAAMRQIITEALGMDRDRLIDDLTRIATDITTYHALPYAAYDVAITADGHASRGDLHIDCNSYTQWHDTSDIMLYLRIHPMYTSAQVEEDSSDAYDAWLDASQYAIGQWARAIADAALEGATQDAIDGIHSDYYEIDW